MRMRILFAALAFGLGAAAMATYNWSRSTPASGLRKPPSEGRPLEAIFDANEPLMPVGERSGSAAEASSKAGYRVAEPSYVPPSVESKEPEVWFAEVTDEAGLRYGSQLVLTYRRWPPETIPAKTYEAQAADWKAGTVELIGSRAAWVIPENAQGPGAPPVNVIHITVDDVDVTLYGRVSMDELRKVAESL